MFFLPYRMDSDKKGIPFVTLLIGIICVMIYSKQYTVDKTHYEAINNFCLHSLSRSDLAFLEKIPRPEHTNACASIFETIRAAENSESEIKTLSKQAKSIRVFANKADNQKYAHERLSELYAKFDRAVPAALTNELAYDPKDPDWLSMFTSTFSHGSFSHLFGNLLFFYIFAASVELIVGSLFFAGFTFVTAIGTSVAYSYAVRGFETALPTVGLSGVVMAAIAALAIMTPTARIRCFLWIIIIFKILRIPVLFLAIWYIGWDIISINIAGNSSPINYVAHISGATIGALAGLFVRVFQNRKIKLALSR